MTGQEWGWQEWAWVLGALSSCGLVAQGLLRRRPLKRQRQQTTQGQARERGRKEQAHFRTRAPVGVERRKRKKGGIRLKLSGARRRNANSVNKQPEHSRRKGEGVRLKLSGARRLNSSGVNRRPDRMGGLMRLAGIVGRYWVSRQARQWLRSIERGGRGYGSTTPTELRQQPLS
jgi:hypothetical protein